MLSRLRTWVWIGLVGACGADFDGEDTELGLEAELARPYTAKIDKKSRTLVITGSSASSRLALRLQTTAVLEVDVGDDGSPDFAFDRAAFERVSINAGGGADVVRMDESRGAFTHEEAISVEGGAGDDTIFGGFGGETLSGGPGHDTIDGGLGADTIRLGAGDDTLVWDPGDASDLVEGGLGDDVLVFNGSGASEEIELTASADRLRLTRNIGNVVMDIDGVERVALHPRGGADRVTVNDLAETDVARVDVNLALLPDAPGGDAQADVTVVNGTAAADIVDLAADGAAVVVDALGSEIGVSGGEPAFDRIVVNAAADDTVNVNGSPEGDVMTVTPEAGAPLVSVAGWGVLVAPVGMGKLALNGLGGDDHITALSVLVPLTISGGDGDDQLGGGAGPDVLLGGGGHDILDGQMGVDTLFLGDGDDVVIWDPGDGSDVIAGGAGTDRLLFNGANVAEQYDLSAVGTHVRLFRNVGSHTLDLDGIEVVELRARGGADVAVVHALAGTSTAHVIVDLGGADVQADTVLVTGTPAADTFDVAAEDAAVMATGTGAKVSVIGAELALDRLAVAASAEDTVNVNGSPGGDTMQAFGNVGATSVQVTGWALVVAPTGMGTLALRGLDGDDTLSVAGSESLTLDGGEGADVLNGGFSPDLLLGGPGDDLIVWDPGDDSDVIEGEEGNDRLLFNGSSIGEQLELGANGERLRLFRNIGSATLDIDGIERLSLVVRSGADQVRVGDLTATAATEVTIDLAATGGAIPDSSVDLVAVDGSPLADDIAVVADGGAVLVTGLAAIVRVLVPDPGDQLVVNGRGGLDTLVAAPGVENLLLLSLQQD